MALADSMRAMILRGEEGVVDVIWDWRGVVGCRCGRRCWRTSVMK